MKASDLCKNVNNAIISDNIYYVTISITVSEVKVFNNKKESRGGARISRAKQLSIVRRERSALSTALLEHSKERTLKSS